MSVQLVPFGDSVIKDEKKEEEGKKEEKAKGNKGATNSRCSITESQRKPKRKPF